MIVTVCLQQYGSHITSRVCFLKPRRQGLSWVNTDDVIVWRWLKGKSELAVLVLLLKYNTRQRADTVYMSCSSLLCESRFSGFTWLPHRSSEPRGIRSGSAFVYQNIPYATVSLAWLAVVYSSWNNAITSSELCTGPVSVISVYILYSRNVSHLSSVRYISS